MYKYRIYVINNNVLNNTSAMLISIAFLRDNSNNAATLGKILIIKNIIKLSG